jgi:hypothetical protein
MRVERTGPLAFALEFANEAELRTEERSNLAVGGLFLRPADPLPPFSTVTVTMRIAGREGVAAAAQVVGAPAGGLALHLTGDAAALVAAILAAPALAREEPPPVTDGDASEGGEDAAESTTLWERLRALTPPQRILLAPKADRVTRALLLQDSDPQVLFALLRNPRISTDEVVRAAKSSFLSFQAVELILKTGPWMANLDIRLALIHNPRTPLPFALRLLPALPDNEVRLIAKGAATSMALKQAALRRVQGG